MKLNKQIIYLDNNATTPIDNLVLGAMMPFLTHQFANANSTHYAGGYAYEAVKLARAHVADLIGADANEIIFTSGATESINLAIKGVAENYQSKGKHIITVSTEHSAVLDSCRYLQTKGFEITYLPVKSDGLIDIHDLKGALRQDTILVSVMLANNETGVLQPIKEISELSHAAGAIFMSDATQAVGKMKINVDDLGIDLLSLSGHKFYAPKGIGALYVRQRKTRIKTPALLHGGGHERGFRSGTLNVPGIVALGEAARIAKIEMSKNATYIGILRDDLETELLKIEGSRVNGNKTSRLFNTSNILFKGVDSDAIITALNNPENDSPLIAISNGSACTSTSITASHVLTSMGLNEEDAFSSLRFSIGKFNTKEEIAHVAKTMESIVFELRKMSGIEIVSDFVTIS